MLMYFMDLKKAEDWVSPPSENYSCTSEFKKFRQSVILKRKLKIAQEKLIPIIDEVLRCKDQKGNTKRCTLTKRQFENALWASEFIKDLNKSEEKLRRKHKSGNKKVYLDTSMLCQLEELQQLIGSTIDKLKSELGKRKDANLSGSNESILLSEQLCIMRSNIDKDAKCSECSLKQIDSKILESIEPSPKRIKPLNSKKIENFSCVCGGGKAAPKSASSTKKYILPKLSNYIEPFLNRISENVPHLNCYDTSIQISNNQHTTTAKRERGDFVLFDEYETNSKGDNILKLNFDKHGKIKPAINKNNHVLCKTKNCKSKSAEKRKSPRPKKEEMAKSNKKSAVIIKQSNSTQNIKQTEKSKKIERRSNSCPKDFFSSTSGSNSKLAEHLFGNSDSAKLKKSNDIINTECAKETLNKCIHDLKTICNYFNSQTDKKTKESSSKIVHYCCGDDRCKNCRSPNKQEEIKENTEEPKRENIEDNESKLIICIKGANEEKDVKIVIRQCADCKNEITHDQNANTLTVTDAISSIHDILSILDEEELPPDRELRINTATIYNSFLYKSKKLLQPNKKQDPTESNEVKKPEESNPSGNSTGQICICTEDGQEFVISLSVAPKKINKEDGLQKENLENNKPTSNHQKLQPLSATLLKPLESIVPNSLKKNIANYVKRKPIPKTEKQRLQHHVCSSMDFDVTCVDTKLRNRGIEHPNPNIVIKLREIGVNNLLLVSKPAKCCRKAVLNERLKKSMPYSASLKSLPLDEKDVTIIQKTLKQKLEKQKTRNEYKVAYSDINNAKYSMKLQNKTASSYNIYYFEEKPTSRLNAINKNVHDILGYYINLISDLKPLTEKVYNVMHFTIEDLIPYNKFFEYYIYLDSAELSTRHSFFHVMFFETKKMNYNKKTNNKNKDGNKVADSFSNAETNKCISEVSTDDKSNSAKRKQNEFKNSYVYLKSKIAKYSQLSRQSEKDETNDSRNILSMPSPNYYNRLGNDHFLDGPKHFKNAGELTYNTYESKNLQNNKSDDKNSYDFPRFLFLDDKSYIETDGRSNPETLQTSGHVDYTCFRNNHPLVPNRNDSSKEMSNRMLFSNKPVSNISVNSQYHLKMYKKKKKARYCLSRSKSEDAFTSEINSTISISTRATEFRNCRIDVESRQTNKPNGKSKSYSQNVLNYFNRMMYRSLIDDLYRRSLEKSSEMSLSRNESWMSMVFGGYSKYVSTTTSITLQNEWKPDFVGSVTPSASQPNVEAFIEEDETNYIKILREAKNVQTDFKHFQKSQALQTIFFEDIHEEESKVLLEDYLSSQLLDAVEKELNDMLEKRKEMELLKYKSEQVMKNLYEDPRKKLFLRYNSEEGFPPPNTVWEKGDYYSESQWTSYQYLPKSPLLSYTDTSDSSFMYSNKGTSSTIMTDLLNLDFNNRKTNYERLLNSYQNLIRHYEMHNEYLVYHNKCPTVFQKAVSRSKSFFGKQMKTVNKLDNKPVIVEYTKTKQVASSDSMEDNNLLCQKCGRYLETNRKIHHSISLSNYCTCQKTLITQNKSERNNTINGEYNMVIEGNQLTQMDLSEASPQTYKRVEIILPSEIKTTSSYGDDAFVSKEGSQTPSLLKKSKNKKSSKQKVKGETPQPTPSHISTPFHTPAQSHTSSPTPTSLPPPEEQNQIEDEEEPQLPQNEDSKEKEEQALVKVESQNENDEPKNVEGNELVVYKKAESELSLDYSTKVSTRAITASDPTEPEMKIVKATDQNDKKSKTVCSRKSISKSKQSSKNSKKCCDQKSKGEQTHCKCGRNNQFPCEYCNEQYSKCMAKRTTDRCSGSDKTIYGKCEDAFTKICMLPPDFLKKKKSCKDEICPCCKSKLNEKQKENLKKWKENNKKDASKAEPETECELNPDKKNRGKKKPKKTKKDCDKVLCPHCLDTGNLEAIVDNLSDLHKGSSTDSESDEGDIKCVCVMADSKNELPDSIKDRTVQFHTTIDKTTQFKDNIVGNLSNVIYALTKVTIREDGSSDIEVVDVMPITSNCFLLPEQKIILINKNKN